MSSVNVIIWLMLSLLIRPKVITLSGFYCTLHFLSAGQRVYNQRISKRSQTRSWTDENVNLILLDKFIHLRYDEWELKFRWISRRYVWDNSRQLKLICHHFTKQHFLPKVLCAGFLYYQFVLVSFCKSKLVKKVLVKCWWNWHLLSL